MKGVEYGEWWMENGCLDIYSEKASWKLRKITKAWYRDGFYNVAYTSQCFIAEVFFLSSNVAKKKKKWKKWKNNNTEIEKK